jgi:hypothetical protein
MIFRGELAVEPSDLVPTTGDFLDPTVILGVKGQLAYGRRYWERFGYEVPDPPEAIQESLPETLAAHPGLRAMQTPLLDPFELQDLAQEVSSLGVGVETESELSIVESNKPWPFPWDINDFQGLLNGVSSFDLRYKAPDGSMVTKGEYIVAMIEGGRAVYDKSGIVWVFPVMDVSPRGERSPDEKNVDLLGRLNPSVLPESLLTIQILHRLNGTPDFSPQHEWDLDIGNRALCGVNEKGETGNIIAVAGVGFHPWSKQIISSFWHRGSSGPGQGIRDTA